MSTAVKRAAYHSLLAELADSFEAGTVIGSNSLPDFDRAAFHEQFNGDVVQFFRAKRQ